MSPKFSVKKNITSYSQLGPRSQRIRQLTPDLTMSSASVTETNSDDEAISHEPISMERTNGLTDKQKALLNSGYTSNGGTGREPLEMAEPNDSKKTVGIAVVDDTSLGDAMSVEQPGSDYNSEFVAFAGERLLRACPTSTPESCPRPFAQGTETFDRPESRSPEDGSSEPQDDDTADGLLFDDADRHERWLAAWNAYVVTAEAQVQGLQWWNNFCNFCSTFPTAMKEFICCTQLINQRDCDTNQEYGAEEFLRPWISCMFGHNKNEYCQRPVSMRICLCRKHYQRMAYDANTHHKDPKDPKSYPNIELKLVRAQFAKDEEWRPHALYKVQLPRSLIDEVHSFNDLVANGKTESEAFGIIEAVRLVDWNRKNEILENKQAAMVARQNENDSNEEHPVKKRNKKLNPEVGSNTETTEGLKKQKKSKNSRKAKTPKLSAAEKTPIKFAVELNRRFCGPHFDKTLPYVRRVVDFIEAKIMDGTIETLPAIEFLLQYRTEDKERIKTLKDQKSAANEKKLPRSLANRHFLIESSATTVGRPVFTTTSLTTSEIEEDLAKLERESGFACINKVQQHASRPSRSLSQDVENDTLMPDATPLEARSSYTGKGKGKAQANEPSRQTETQRRKLAGLPAIFPENALGQGFIMRVPKRERNPEDLEYYTSDDDDGNIDDNEDDDDDDVPTKPGQKNRKSRRN
ncbi:hypothetical protein MBLNU459_g0671t1 [Dothideomycetes sp. NU459]